MFITRGRTNAVKIGTPKETQKPVQHINKYVKVQHWLLYSTSINLNCYNMKLKYNVGCSVIKPNTENKHNPTRT